MSAPKEPTEAKPKGKKKSLMMIIAGVVLLAGGGGGFFWWKNQQAAQAKAEKGHDEAEEEADAEEHGGGAEDASGVLSFEPFIVNLSDGAQRYLKAEVRLLISGEENMKELEENAVMTSRLRSAILEHLSQQTSDHIVTPEGKEALKHEIAERCTKILGHAKVVDVLFSEFVVQF